MAGDDGHDHDKHDHGTLRYQGAHVEDEVLERIRAIHPELARNLELARRHAELTDDERAALGESAKAVEKHAVWTPGYYAAGDRCATCGEPTTLLFTDRFEQGELPYAAFILGLPVHATPACIEGFDKRRPSRAPRAMDQARRELTKDLNRPSPGMTQFFRHDVLVHPPFSMEDWANSVAASNPDGLSRPAMKDIERLVQWIHHRLFHHH